MSIWRGQSLHLLHPTSVSCAETELYLCVGDFGWVCQLGRYLLGGGARVMCVCLFVYVVVCCLLLFVVFVVVSAYVFADCLSLFLFVYLLLGIFVIAKKIVCFF